MSKIAKEPILLTAILCLIMLVVTFPAGTGYMLVFWALFLIPLTLHRLYVVFIKKQEKTQRLIQMALWGFSFLIVIVHHVYLHKTTRAYANQVSDKIEGYYTKNGHYPKAIEATGFEKDDLRQYRMIYVKRNDEPHLHYSDTLSMFASYSYDFSTNSWKYYAD